MKLAYTSRSSTSSSSSLPSYRYIFCVLLIVSSYSLLSLPIIILQISSQSPSIIPGSYHAPSLRPSCTNPVCCFQDYNLCPLNSSTVQYVINNSPNYIYYWVP